MQVKDIMRQAIVIEKDMILQEAARLMASKKIGSLLFVSRGQLKGIITERDVLKNFNNSKRVSDVMAREVIVIEPNDELSAAFELMRKHDIKRLPVVEDKKLAGIITATDLIAHWHEVDSEESFLIE